MCQRDPVTGGCKSGATYARDWVLDNYPDASHIEASCGHAAPGPDGPGVAECQVSFSLFGAEHSLGCEIVYDDDDGGFIYCWDT